MVSRSFLFFIFFPLTGGGVKRLVENSTNFFFEPFPYFLSWKYLLQKYPLTPTDLPGFKSPKSWIQSCSLSFLERLQVTTAIWADWLKVLKIKKLVENVRILYHSQPREVLECNDKTADKDIHEELSQNSKMKLSSLIAVIVIKKGLPSNCTTARNVRQHIKEGRVCVNNAAKIRGLVLSKTREVTPNLCS